ncbi:2-Hydroxyacid oxidase 1-like [Haemaphysalis longicornis]
MGAHGVAAPTSTIPELKVKTLEDIERMAVAKLDPGPRAYYTMGADQEQTLAENKLAFKRLRLLPRLLRGVAKRNLETSVLGQKISMPIGISPTALHRMAHPDGELATAKAAGAAGTVMVLSLSSTTSMEDVRDAAPNGLRWFQIYVMNNRQLTQRLVVRAQQAGYRALVFTADSPVAGSRTEMLGEYLKRYSEDLRPANFSEAELSNSGGAALAQQILDPSLTWKELAWLKSISSLPIVVKGVLTVESAILALDHGASAILVSNHGGRELDGVPATIDVLPDIVRAVGHRCEVYMDSGVRQGTDVVKALALGARAVFVGRPVIFGLAYNGEEGVSEVLQILRSELDRAIALMGCRSVGELHSGMVVQQERFSRM